MGYLMAMDKFYGFKDHLDTLEGLRSGGDTMEKVLRVTDGNQHLLGLQKAQLRAEVQKATFDAVLELIDLEVSKGDSSDIKSSLPIMRNIVLGMEKAEG